MYACIAINVMTDIRKTSHDYVANNDKFLNNH